MILQWRQFVNSEALRLHLLLSRCDSVKGSRTNINYIIVLVLLILMLISSILQLLLRLFILGLIRCRVTAIASDWIWSLCKAGHSRLAHTLSERTVVYSSRTILASRDTCSSAVYSHLLIVSDLGEIRVRCCRSVLTAGTSSMMMKIICCCASSKNVTFLAVIGLRVKTSWLDCGSVVQRWRWIL